MSFTPLKIEGSWVFTPKTFMDERGSFHEVFRQDLLGEGFTRNFQVKQANQSTSKIGVIRGIHWADNPPGQAKYIFCSKGAIWDVVVDLRIGSPTFGQFDTEILSEKNGKSIFIEEGLGHGFLSLEGDTVVNYFCSEPFNPGAEHAINPLDPELSIPFESVYSGNFIVSQKDLDAPSLLEAKAASIFPKYEK
jgi:dTDP-4-dehydrorhamnose 3,5-epimerase